MKKFRTIGITVILTVLVMLFINHRPMRHNGRPEGRMNDRHMMDRKDRVRIEKSDTAYVEVGHLLKPYEVERLMRPQTL
jgi:hypothetical protein